MSVYFSTFVSGFQDAVESILKDIVKDAEILKLLDGLVMYETKLALDSIKAIKIFNNTFLMVNQYAYTGANPIEFALEQFFKIKKRNENVLSILKDLKPKTFRIVTSRENKLTAIEGNLRKSVESKISKEYSLRPDRLTPDIEFWAVARSEGIVLIGLRLTRKKSTDKILLKGELRPELSNLLCWLSEPSDNDVFLDPFCGYGSIPFERSLLMNYKEVLASDIDSEKILFLSKKFINKNQRVNVKLLNADFFESKFLQKGSIDKIVTDPPWGDFEELNEQLIDFYRKFLKKSLYCLKENGILVFITSRKDESEKVIEEFSSGFKMVLKLDILVSGKKAAVYKLTKVCKT